MKIACLISSLRLGGAERQLVGLAKSLKEAGNEVTVLTYRPGDFYARELCDSGVSHKFAGNGKSDSAIVRALVNYINGTGTEVLISFLTGANVKACKAKDKCPGLRVIVSERNCNICLLPHDSWRFHLYKDYADAVVCNSYSQKEFIDKNCNWLTYKTVCIPNFVDFENFFPAVTKVNPTPIITVMARVCARKNTLGLILAASRVSRKVCRVDGRRGIDLREQIVFDESATTRQSSKFIIKWYGMAKETPYVRLCRCLIMICGLKNQFLLLPASHDARQVYCESDFFCLPSFYEGTSNALAEALACGLPVICSHVSDNYRYVLPRKNGFLFNPYKLSSIVKAITDLLESDLEAVSAMKTASFEIARKSFEKERMVKGFLKIILKEPRMENRNKTLNLEELRRNR